MVSPEEISMSRIVKHQTMRSNLPVESPKNFYLRNLYYQFFSQCDFTVRFTISWSC